MNEIYIILIIIVLNAIFLKHRYMKVKYANSLSSKFYTYIDRQPVWPDTDTGLSCPNSDIARCHYTYEDVARSDCIVDPKCMGYAARHSSEYWYPNKNATIYKTYNNSTDSYFAIPGNVATVYKKKHS